MESKLFFEHRCRQYLEIALSPPAPPVTNTYGGVGSSIASQNRDNVGHDDDYDVFETPTNLRRYPITGADASNSTISHISSGSNEHNLEEGKGDEDNDEVEFVEFNEHARNHHKEEEDNGGRRYDCRNNDVDAATMTMSRGFDIVGAGGDNGRGGG